MIIIYQIRKYLHKSVDLPNQTCCNCKTEGSLRMYVSQKYTWLISPMFPSVKLAEIRCEKCGHLFPSINWTKEQQETGEKEIANTKTPAWMWRGLYILPLIVVATIGIFILVLKNTGNAYEEEINLRNERLKNLHAGQTLYLFDFKAKSVEKANTFSYIEKIDGDTIFLKDYKRETGMLEGWQKMHINDFAPYELSNETRKLSKKRIFDNDQGDLFDFNDTLTVSASIKGIIGD